MKRILATMAGSALMFLAASHVLAGEKAAAQGFKPGDRWCAIGDSITHGGGYVKDVYLFYATRFPGMKLEYFNCGVGGGIVRGALERLEEDILAHKPTVATIMFGVNDIWWEYNKLMDPNDYERELGTLVDRLRAKRCRPVIITPPIYDDTAKGKEPVDPIRQRLPKNIERARRVAREKGVELIDNYAFMKKVTTKGQAKDPTFTLFAEDRVHPTEIGHFVMAYGMLKALGMPAQVAALELDAKEGKATRRANCKIKDMAFAPDGKISFSLLEGALPYPVQAVPQEALRLVPFIKDFNQETIKVTGLDRGRYRLTIDGKDVGTYRGGELAAGINLAENPHTPQSEQARRMAEFNDRRNHAEAYGTRHIVMMEYGQIMKRIKTDDVQAGRAAIEARIKAEFKDPKAAQAFRDQFKLYLEIKGHESRLAAEARDCDAKMREIAQPQCHRYELSRSEP